MRFYILTKACPTCNAAVIVRPMPHRVEVSCTLCAWHDTLLKPLRRPSVKLSYLDQHGWAVRLGQCTNHTKWCNSSLSGRNVIPDGKRQLVGHSRSVGHHPAA